MSIKSIIKEAYLIFDYPTPTSINNVCTNECCMPKENAIKLITTPKNEIDVSLINEYNDNAQATNYNMIEFKYFLPRYLELISKFNFPSALDVSLSLKNLNFDNVSFWQNKSEIEIIEAFALEFSQLCYNDSTDNSKISFIDLINLFHTAKIDIVPILENFINNININRILSISELILYGINNRGTKIENAFVSKDLSNILLQWIRNNKRYFMEYIETFIMNSNNDKHSQELSYTYDILKYF